MFINKAHLSINIMSVKEINLNKYRQQAFLPKEEKECDNASSLCYFILWLSKQRVTETKLN